MTTIDNVAVGNLVNGATASNNTFICTNQTAQHSSFQISFAAPSGNVPELIFIYDTPSTCHRDCSPVV